MKKILWLALLGTAALWTSASLGTSHAQIGCMMCHVPHHAGDPNNPTSHGIPLWNSQNIRDGLANFTPYSSQSFDKLHTDIGQPDGASRMCLGCHDGSYQFVDPAGTRIFRAGDLARSHPVSFTYNAALAGRAPGGKLRDPAAEPSGFGGTIAGDLLDGQGKLQCDSCHDIHSGGLTPNMLRWNIAVSSEATRMCRTCHNR